MVLTKLWYAAYVMVFSLSLILEFYRSADRMLRFLVSQKESRSAIGTIRSTLTPGSLDELRMMSRSDIWKQENHLLVTTDSL